MAKTGEVRIERDKRLSESMLWASQREYYHEQGVSAWSGAVPFYITSNPYIANAYANIVVRYIQDCLRVNPKAINETFYIMEIGSGSGQFSFYVQKRLKYLLDALAIQKLKYCYVMTDFTKNNIGYWEDHLALKPFLKENILDFAVYDAEKNTPIRLIRNKRELSPKTIKNPLIVFANYLFDSLINDVFSVKNARVFESLISIHSRADNVKNRKPLRWDRVKFSFHDRECKSNYYENSRFNEVLASYAQDLSRASFLFPIGALQCLENLQAISRGQLLLISTDKGFSYAKEMDNTERPEFDFHGSFSLMVNYDALAKYFRASGGDAFLQAERDDVVTNVFVSGTHFNERAETGLSLQHFVAGLSPGDYFNLYDHMIKDLPKTKIEALVSFLILSDWDPFVYEDFADYINDEVHNIDPDLVDYISDHLPKIAEKFYYLPKAYDIFFDMAIFYQNLERYEEARRYYDISEGYFGESYSLFYNRGLCYYYDQKLELALGCFTKAEKQKPRDKDALHWAKMVSKELNKRKSK